MSKKDNQHFVQKAYLKGFTTEKNPSELWEYDKEEKCISHRIKSVREICSLYQYYAAPGEDGEIDPEVIENELCKVEDPFIRVLNTIHPTKDQEFIELSGEQWADMAYYIGMQLARVPMYRGRIKGFMDNVLSKAAEAIANNDIKEGRMPEELKEYFEGGGKILADSEEWATIEFMADGSDMMTKSLLSKQWLFMVPHEDIPLIISDNPVVTAPLTEEKKSIFGGSGPAGYNRSVYMPLRKDLAVLIAPCKFFGTDEKDIEKENFRVMYVDKGYTKDLNKQTARNAMRYVYNGTKDEKLGKMVFKFKPRKP